MTENEMLVKVLKTGKKMRFWQNNYFKQKDKFQKRLALIESKKSEREFDKCILNFSHLLNGANDVSDKPQV